jgi:hypothetical protein
MVTKRKTEKRMAGALTSSSRLSPPLGLREGEIDAAIESIKSLRERTKKISLQEILSSRHEGHKY